MGHTRTWSGAKWLLMAAGPVAPAVAVDLLTVTGHNVAVPLGGQEAAQAGQAPQLRELAAESAAPDRQHVGGYALPAPPTDHASCTLFHADPV